MKTTLVAAVSLTLLTIAILLGYKYLYEGKQYVQDVNRNPQVATPLPDSLLFEQEPAPSIDEVSDWLNTSGDITLAQYKGKIVLIVFGRLDCSYCNNIYTYLTEWNRKYSSKLVILGIQSPKYEDEKSVERIKKEIIDEHVVSFPVGIDIDQKVAKSYSNDFIPAAYLIDKAGYVRYHHFGEGSFSEIEKAFLELQSQYQ